jgi:tetratricopeptide (TPR) repeat protein
MIHGSPTAALMLALTISLSPAFAAATYHDSLVAGDKALAASSVDDALGAYSAALDHATSDGERALALAKQGYVLAYLKHDYAAARTAVDEGLAMKDLAPVARVTLLQVVAHCQMNADKDFAAAAVTLEEALGLEGVDWAKPGLTLALGDCQRETGAMDKALATYAEILAMPQADAGTKAGSLLCSGFIHQYDRHDAAKARECYEKAVALRPGLKAEVDGHLGRLP